jgi:archaellum biogenesis ATPase FlaH
MSVDYNALLGIGRRFSEEAEVKDFLLQKTDLSIEQIEHMLEGNLGYLGMSVVCLDCYSGEDWFVGFEIGGEQPDTLINSVVDAHERWKAVFSGVDPRVVHAVKIY